MSDKKTPAEIELEHLKKQLAESEKARDQAERSAEAERQAAVEIGANAAREAADLERELAIAKAQARAAEGAGVVSFAKPATEPVTPADIRSTKIRALHAKAKGNAEKYIDHPTGRRDLAIQAQDHLIALRDLNVPFNSRGVALHVGGDLYVGPKGVHPRAVAAELESKLDVATLAELVDELNAAHEYEAS